MLIKIYWICLIVGGLYGGISLLLSNIVDGLDIDLDMGDFSLPLKPFTLMVFATVFGGAGLIGLHFWDAAWLSILVAATAGALIAYALYHLVYVRLQKYEKLTSTEEDALMEKAVVVERILPSGYGKISYVMDGNTLSGPAREMNPGSGISKGKTVYILDIKDNVYYVCDSLEL